MSSNRRLLLSNGKRNGVMSTHHPICVIVHQTHCKDISVIALVVAMLRDIDAVTSLAA